MTRPAFLSRRRWIAIGAGICWSRPGFSTDASAHVTAVAFAPEGKQIVTGSQAGVVVRDDGGQVLRDLPSELDNVHDLRFWPDGKLLAVAGGTPGESGIVEFFDWPSGILRQRIEEHDDVVYQVAPAADGSKWAAASADEVCTVYRWETDSPLTRFTKHSRPVLAVTILPDGKTAVSGSTDETLRVWDMESGESLRTLHIHSRGVHALALQPGERKLPTVASAAADGTVRLWQPTIGRMVRFARVPSDPLAIAWVAGGTKLVAGCRDGKLRLVDPVTVEVVDTVDITSGWLYAVGVDPTDDRRLAVGGSRGLLDVLRI